VLRYLLIILAAACSAFGQTYAIKTFAGGGLPVNVAGSEASLGLVEGVAVDSHGNVLIAATNYNIVLRLDAASGMLTLAAGNGTAGFSGDGGPATSAQLSIPLGIVVDAAGNLYIPDAGNNRIRKVSDGVITTVNRKRNQWLQWRQRPGHQRRVERPRRRGIGHRGQLVHRRRGQHGHSQGLEWSHHDSGGRRDRLLTTNGPVGRRVAGHQRSVERSGGRGRGYGRQRLYRRRQ
jgi:hypothetical protein